jgi:hypothetical protein
MRRLMPILCVLLAGCSTHPCADFLDHFFPGRVYADPQTAPHGGVCIPQGAPLCPGVPGTPGTVPLGPPVFPGTVPPTPTPIPPAGGLIPPPPPPPPPGR